MKAKKQNLRHGLTGLILAIIFLLAAGPVGPVFGGENNEVVDMAPNSKAAILYEATTGTVLYEKNADERRAPASMTKVMTAILVLEQNPNLEGELTVSKDAVRRYYCSSMEPQKHLLEGEVISYEECMKYLLIPSGNEAATAFAFDMCDDYKDFIAMMNEKAEELGCENTQFQDCIGLASGEHYTTPRDMVKICEYAMQFDKFRECVSKSEGVVPASNVRDEGFAYETTNRVKFPDDRYESPYSQYMTGVKTGYTPAAGWCFAGCMEKDGLVFYSVVMGGELKDYKDGERVVQGDFLDTINLYSLTDGLTAENIEERYPQSSASPLMIGAAVVVLAVIVLLWFKMWKRRPKKEA
ncbi:D-alanyl-D-alanine carboxypeptidase family protein [Ihubacter sp. mB4P-1]|uniref:D-alanyl-D-alanine carboxypeptidase family protein n=1 Tax=Ihubacter sp. mB4P-1 TaxID=3242370 RepID=UPI003C7B6D29